jgi:hypothetical protein
MSDGHEIYQHLPSQDPQSFPQIWIFGLKVCHLATLQTWRERRKEGGHGQVNVTEK